jgi:hypothetical protein
MKNRKLLRALVFVAGFFFAFLVFFPLNHFKGQVLGTVFSQTGIRISSKNISLGTGLGIGLARGGILAFHLDDFQLVTSTGQKVFCKEASLSPHIWPLFIGQIHLGLACEDKKSGQLLGKLELAPIWGPQTADLFLTFEDLSLSMLNTLFPGSGNFSGKANGTASATKIQLNNPNAIPRVEWELNAVDVALPALSSPLLSLPSLKMGPLKSKGVFRLPKLAVESLEFGNDQSSIKGNWSMNFDLGPTMMPVKGEWKGSFKADSEMERLGIGGYKLDQLFGPLQANGTREFRKTLREGENILSLLVGPPNGG